MICADINNCPQKEQGLDGYCFRIILLNLARRSPNSPTGLQRQDSGIVTGWIIFRNGICCCGITEKKLLCNCSPGASSSVPALYIWIMLFLDMLFGYQRCWGNNNIKNIFTDNLFIMIATHDFLMRIVELKSCSPKISLSYLQITIQRRHMTSRKMNAHLANQHS